MVGWYWKDQVACWLDSRVIVTVWISWALSSLVGNEHQGNVSQCILWPSLYRKCKGPAVTHFDLICGVKKITYVSMQNCCFLEIQWSDLLQTKTGRFVLSVCFSSCLLCITMSFSTALSRLKCLVQWSSKESDPLEDPTLAASISTTTCLNALKILLIVLPVSPWLTYQAMLLTYPYLFDITLFCERL